MIIDLKPPLTYDEQVQLLKERRLIIKDEEYAKGILSRISYYRLSAYSLGLRENDIFKENVTFEQIYNLYEFDAELRNMLLKIIENIEVMFRVKIAHRMAIKYGAESYLNKYYFQSQDFHKRFITELKEEQNRQKTTTFIEHHNNKYGGRLPIWVVVEIFSFGMLSRFFSNMKEEDQKEISKSFGTSPKYLRTWLKSLVEVRNICAHYGRIYNRPLTSSPKLYSEYSAIRTDRIFKVFIVIRRLIHNEKQWRNFSISLYALIEKYKEVINISYIGFPEDWKKILGEYLD